MGEGAECGVAQCRAMPRFRERNQKTKNQKLSGDQILQALKKTDEGGKRLLLDPATGGLIEGEHRQVCCDQWLN